MFGTDIDDFAVRLPFGPKETLSFESVNPKEWKTPPRTDTHTKISKRVNKNKQNKTKQNKTNKIITSVYIYIYIYMYSYYSIFSKGILLEQKNNLKNTFQYSFFFLLILKTHHTYLFIFIYSYFFILFNFPN